METMLINNQDKIEFSEKMGEFIRTVAEKAAAILNIPENSELSIILVDNDYIQELNLTYRKIDAPTDVLSFPMNEMGAEEPDFDIEEEINLLGDIAISLQQTEKQRLEYGHSFERELAFLLIHGILHLEGYDHQNDEEEQVMRQMQNKILQALGLER